MVTERVEAHRFNQGIEYALGDNAAVDAIRRDRRGSKGASGCTSPDQLRGEMFSYDA